MLFIGVKSKSISSWQIGSWEHMDVLESDNAKSSRSISSVTFIWNCSSIFLVVYCPQIGLFFLSSRTMDWYEDIRVSPCCFGCILGLISGIVILYVVPCFGLASGGGTHLAGLIICGLYFLFFVSTIMYLLSLSLYFWRECLRTFSFLT